MGLELSRENGGEHLYLSVYHYYKELITQGKMIPGSKMPSLRKCSEELHLSRTTIENAYLQLAADGFIISKAQSGYYVTNLSTKPVKSHTASVTSQNKIQFNLSSSGADRESFRFDLWQRYIKSALRQNERLLSYGDPQGEYDFREALADYVRERRNIHCSADDIVVAAGVQSLLHILCPLLKEYKTVSFPTPSFIQGATVFSDYDFDVRYRDKDSGVIYVSPAHMTKWGDIMPISRRMELIHYAAEHGSLIIEDDFENEFVYLQKPTPSIFSLASGKDVLYIGSFSRLLLPSIRISFMILPEKLRLAYQKKAKNYNQTASKAEQIALCQFIRDGHLSAQTRRLKRLYSQKMKTLLEEIEYVFEQKASIKMGSAGTTLALTLPCTLSKDEVLKKAMDEQLSVQIISIADGQITFLLSCSSLRIEEYRPALKKLKTALGGQV